VLANLPEHRFRIYLLYSLPVAGAVSEYAGLAVIQLIFKTAQKKNLSP
jgi:hypothetical protein